MLAGHLAVTDGAQLLDRVGAAITGACGPCVTG